MKKKNIYITAGIGLCEEIAAIICGFILPRMILTYFGSAYNGIVAAVTQFIGCIALLKSGIGMATKAALYEPLANNDIEKVSGVMAATTKFLRKVAYIFVIGILVFAAVYPALINKEFSWSFTFSLVLIISLGTFFQYYFGLSNQLLLDADQKYYIVSIIAIVNTVFNTIISVICMKLGMPIHVVKVCSATVYCATPILLYLYVNKKYNINRRAKPDYRSISHRWNALGMQIANFINNNTDIIVASIFLNLKEVSVYTIYYLAINGVKKVVVRMSTGVEAALGNIVASKNDDNIRSSFFTFEYVLNFLCAFAFSCLTIIIIPFVKVYTEGINDVNYIRYSFAFVACFAEMFYCLRLAYTFLVQAKGAFSETKRFYYIEATINIIVSIVLVNVLGLTGIVIGTLAGMIYRTVTFAKYVYKEVVNASMKHFWMRMVVTLAIIAFNNLVCNLWINNVVCCNYITLLGLACMVATCVLLLTTLIHLMIYPTQTKTYFRKIVSVFAK